MASAAELDVVITLAREAGALVRREAGHSQRLLKRAPGEAIAGWDPVEAVTETDRATQRLIIAGLSRHFPDDGVIGEESDTGGITHRPPARGARTWVIDPIDGTNNFCAGLGCFAVCIGLLEDGLPTLGVVYDVARDCVYAATGGQAQVDGVPVRAATAALSDRSLVMLTSNLLDRQGRLPGFIGEWLTHAPWKLRMLGSAALEAVQVGAGVAHAAVTINGKLWDVAAAAAVILASGGRVVDLHGAPVFPVHLQGYQGAKIPFLALAPGAGNRILDDIHRFGWDDSN